MWFCFMATTLSPPALSFASVSSHFIIRRLTQFAASVWLLVPRDSLAKSPELLSCGEEREEGRDELWLAPESCGSLWLVCGLTASFSSKGDELCHGAPLPLVKTHPFLCSDWPAQISPRLQLCYSVRPNLVVVQFAWLAFSSTIVTINIWWLYQSIYWAGLRPAAALPPMKMKGVCFISLGKRNCEERSRHDVYRDFASDVKLYFICLTLE